MQMTRRLGTKQNTREKDEKRVEFIKLKRIPCLNGTESQGHKKRLIW